MLRFLRMGSKRTKVIWWILVVITVFTFVLGFNFLFGLGDPGQQARIRGDVGVVNGQRVSRTEYQSALGEQREQFKRQYGAEPVDRDLKIVEQQAWRSLVTQHLLAAEARRAGLGATDGEVVFALRTSPPPMLLAMPAFQTDGKFDPAKYQAAMTDPKNDWSAFEAMVRDQLPVRKLQERLIASVKLAEPEMQQTYRDRFERVNATVLMVPLPTDASPTPPNEAALQRAYDQYKGRFASGPRTRLEVLIAPKKYGDEEIKTARDLAQSLTDRARRGESFADLARDYSEGAGADKGGLIDRVIQPAELGPALGQHLMSIGVGAVSDPYQEGGRFLIFKVMEQARDSLTGQPGLKLAQIMIKVRPGEGSLRTQFDGMRKLRSRAARVGLARAATEQGLSTLKTGYFDFDNEPRELSAVPEAAEWGLGAKLNAVSPVFEGLDEFVVVQAIAQKPAGPPARAEIDDLVRQLAAMGERVQRSKPVADRLAQALAGGATLEQAAAANGITPIKIAGMSRVQPDPRLASVPEVQGALFGAAPGKVLGPIATPGAYYFARVDSKIPADPAAFDAIKGQLSSDILTRRQQSFFGGYLALLRSKGKVQDLRAEGSN